MSSVSSLRFVLRRAIAAVAFVSVPAFAQFGQGANVAGDPSGVLRLGPLTKVAAETAEIVSTFPERFPKELLPPGARFTAASSAPSMAVVVVTAPPEIGAQPWRYRWALEDLGWINYTPGSFGFRPASTGAAGRMTGVPGLTNAGATLQLCKGQDFVDVTFWRIPDGPFYLRFAVGPDNRRSCVARPFGSFGDVPLPEIVMPQSIRVMGSGSGGSQDDTEARTRLDLTAAPGVTPGTLAEDCVRQMSAAGWKLEAPASGDAVMVTARLSTRSRAGDGITAIVVVTALADTPFVDAIVRVVRNKPGR